MNEFDPKPYNVLDKPMNLSRLQDGVDPDLFHINLSDLAVPLFQCSFGGKGALNRLPFAFVSWNVLAFFMWSWLYLL